MNKSEIRKKKIKLRKLNNSKHLVINIKSIIKILKTENIKGKVLGGYYPYNYEIDAVQILEKFERYNYHICLPKIKKNFDMDFFYWSAKEPLCINQYGIPEPISNKVEYPDIILVPLVAYDRNFNRIGYGGGYYDRYFKKIKKMKKVVTIGLAHSCQKVKEIPIDKYDIKLDFIITEKQN